MSSNVLTERRTICPSLVVTIIGQLWPTIEHLKVLNQTITLDKLKAHMYKKYRMNSIDCEKLVTNALKDKLLITTDGKDKSGEQIPIYLIPDDNRVDDGHDWYCYECHKPGTVVQCVDCWRVFHSYCVKQSFNEIEEPFICGICRQLDKEVEGKVGTKVVEIKQLNELLGYVYNQLTKNQEMTDLITIKDDDPNIRQLLYYRIDLSQILFKTKNNSYKKLIEFQTDVQNVVHCMSLLHGTNGVIIGLAAQLFNDCIKELDQMKECIDCYRMSNQKQDKHWFCKPCDPLHELVFAKQKGWPFWPAKVIRRNPITNECKVRFFGQFHEVSTIDNENVKPIDTTLQQLRIFKQSPPLTQALRELKQYQNNLLPIGSDTTAIRSPIRAASAKRPRRRADGTRPRKRSIKMEIKSETDNNDNDQQNESSSDSNPPVINPNESSFLVPQTTGPKQWRTSTPKPFSKTFSPIKTRNRGMKIPFQTKTLSPDTGSKRTPKRRSLQRVNSPIKRTSPLSPRFKRNISEIASNVSTTSSVKPKTVVNNKRKKRVINGLTDNKSDGLDSGEEELTKIKKIKTEVNAQTSSLARSRPVRQIKPNSRFKSPEMEVKIPKRKLRNEKIIAKKESTEQSVPMTQTNGDTEYIFTDDSNSANNSVINNTKTKTQIKGKRLNAVKIESKTSPIEVTVVKRVVSPPPSTLRSFGSFGAISPVPNGPSIISPPISPVVSPKGRGRPKGVKNKSTLEKLKLEALKATEVSPQKPDLKAPILTKELNDSSNDCNCKLKGCCKQKFNKVVKKLEEKHKEDSKKLKKDLESVKQQNYRLLNENKSLKDESQGRDEFNALIEKHSQEIKELKKKQWCWHCGKEAIYFCCWNTSYCSTECQQQHWNNGHKKTCRRMAKR